MENGQETKKNALFMQSRDKGLIVIIIWIIEFFIVPRTITF